MSWKLNTKIEKIVESACIEIPYESTNIDKTRIVDDVESLIEGLLKGYMTYINSNYEFNENKGWKNKEDGGIYNRGDIVDNFLNEKL